MDIINKIESFEQDAFNKWSSKCINTYDTEIKSIEDQLNKLDLTEITKQIDEVKYKIEKILFSNKSILFIEKDSFLLIINDEYIQKSSIENYSKEKLATRKVNYTRKLRYILQQQHKFQRILFFSFYESIFPL